jgi:hypothetical protein
MFPTQKGYLAASEGRAKTGWLGFHLFLWQATFAIASSPHFRFSTSAAAGRKFPFASHATICGMQLPFQKMLFDLRDLRFWVEAQKVKPTQIEMNEGQYAWFAQLCHACKKDFEGIPIVFTDARPSIDRLRTQMRR